MAYKLSNLKIRRVSLVDSPASVDEESGFGAHVEMFKARASDGGPSPWVATEGEGNWRDEARHKPGELAGDAMPRAEIYEHLRAEAKRWATSQPKFVAITQFGAQLVASEADIISAFIKETDTGRALYQRYSRHRPAVPAREVKALAKGAALTAKLAGLAPDELAKHFRNDERAFYEYLSAQRAAVRSRSY